MTPRPPAPPTRVGTQESSQGRVSLPLPPAPRAPLPEPPMPPSAGCWIGSVPGVVVSPPSAFATLPPPIPPAPLTQSEKLPTLPSARPPAPPAPSAPWVPKPPVANAVGHGTGAQQLGPMSASDVSAKLLQCLAPVMSVSGPSARVSDAALAGSASKFLATMCEHGADGVVSSWVLSLVGCVLDYCSSGTSPALFPGCLTKLVSTHNQTAHLMWARPDHLRVVNLKGPCVSEERRIVINAELNSLMVRRCLPLVEPKNVRFATMPNAKPIFLSPPERRLFFAMKGVIDTDCNLDAMNSKIETLLACIPVSIMKPQPSCPIDGVFPPLPPSSTRSARAAARRSFRHKRRFPKVSDGASSQGFVGPIQPKRRRKVQVPVVPTCVTLPDEFSAHSPQPLLVLLASVPRFTASGEVVGWRSCKLMKVPPLEGKENDFESLVNLISQRLAAWGITSDMKKGDVAWVTCEQMLSSAGVLKPLITSVGPMLRWWIEGFARYILAL